MIAAVDTLRATFLDEARTAVARARAESDRQASTMLSEAEERGKALVEQAHADGIAAAAMAGKEEQVAARRQARAIVLAARRELYEELCREVRAAARTLRDRPGYAALLDRLTAAVRAQLGEDALLEVDPPGAGGVRGSSGPRHVDYTLDALAERCLGRLGGELERLWS